MKEFYILVTEKRSFIIKARNRIEAYELANKKPSGTGHCFDREILMDDIEDCGVEE